MGDSGGADWLLISPAFSSDLWSAPRNSVLLAADRLFVRRAGSDSFVLLPALNPPDENGTKLSDERLAAGPWLNARQRNRVALRLLFHGPRRSSSPESYFTTLLRSLISWSLPS